MCGRYSNHAAFSEIRLELQVRQLELFRDWVPTYNISPSFSGGYEQLIVTQAPGVGPSLRLARWWMIPPFWRKPLKLLPTSFNARAEEIAKKPFWKEAFSERRCLVPATGWREFRDVAGRKQPYHFHFKKPLFAFAGVWSTWRDGEGAPVDSFAIVTAPPSEVAAPIHDRMPLVVSPEEYQEWLTTSTAEGTLQRLCQTALHQELLVYPSDPIANNSRYEGPRTIERVCDSPHAVQQSLFDDEALRARKAPKQRF